MISFVEKSLEKSRAQDAAIEAILVEMKGIRDEVKSDVKDVKEMVVEVRNRVHLEEADANKIKSIVGKKAHAISKQKYSDTKEYGAEYLELVGYARRHVYKRLKEHFNVTKYTAIRHVDREKAINFVSSIVLGSEFLQEYEQWRYQRIKKREREMNALKGLGK